MTKRSTQLEVSARELNDLFRELQMASVLQEIALSLPLINNRQQLCEQTAEATASVLGAPQAALLLLNQDGTLLEGPANFDRGRLRKQPLQVPLGRGLIGSCSAEGAAILVAKASAHERFDPQVDTLGGKKLTTLLGVPLKIRDSLAGCLLAANRKQPFTSHDLRWLSSLAAMVAAVYDNTRLIERLREEQAALLEAQEQLRRKLARELHDGATQRIAAALMQLDYLRRVLQHDPQQLERELDHLEHMLQRTMRMLRVALFDLRPLLLETEGLKAALQRFVHEHSSERGPALRLEIAGSMPPLRNTQGGAIFSIVQEAVNNAQKHAGATEVTISLSQEAAQLVICIRDNGRGFNPQEVAAGYALGSSFGMRNMRELVDAIGGSLIIWSQPGSGTSITITVPRAQLHDPAA